MSLLVKIAGARLPSQEIVLARAVVTLLLSYALVRRARVSAWGTNRSLLAVRGIVGFVGLSGFYYGVVHLPLAEATVIQYTKPVFATLLAIPLLQEKLRARDAIILLVSMLGVIIVTRPTFLFGGANAQPLASYAVIISLIGAIGSAAAYVTVRRLGKTERASVIVFYFALISVIGAVPMALRGALWPTPPVVQQQSAISRLCSLRCGAHCFLPSTLTSPWCWAHSSSSPAPSR